MVCKLDKTKGESTGAAKLLGANSAVAIAAGAIVSSAKLPVAFLYSSPAFSCSFVCVGTGAFVYPSCIGVPVKASGLAVASRLACLPTSCAPCTAPAAKFSIASPIRVPASAKNLPLSSAVTSSICSSNDGSTSPWLFK